MHVVYYSLWIDQFPLYISIVAELLESIGDNPDFRYFVPLENQMLVSSDILMFTVFPFLDSKTLVGTNYVFSNLCIGLNH